MCVHVCGGGWVGPGGRSGAGVRTSGGGGVRAMQWCNAKRRRATQNMLHTSTNTQLCNSRITAAVEAVLVGAPSPAAEQITVD